MKRIWIYESELRAIAQESLAWESETGGDLFGMWAPEPVVYLATRMGPDSKRGRHACQFDLPYLERLNFFLASEWGLNYFGDWHSHFLSQHDVPSRTDRNRIGRLLQRLGFPQIIEFIINVAEATPDAARTVRVQGFEFPQETWYSPDALTITICPGISPLRAILTNRNVELHQDWTAWKSVDMDKISGHQCASETASVFKSFHQVFTCPSVENTSS
ncbi:MAG: hypothetical protein R3C17_21885 [Planctomycetaceae bacterium]